MQAREDQLKWLERQFTHLGKEYESMVAARDADEQGTYLVGGLRRSFWYSVAHFVM